MAFSIPSTCSNGDPKRPGFLEVKATINQNNISTMKTFTLIKSVLVCAVVQVASLAAGQTSYPENFDLAGNWTGGPAGSYTAKTYASDAEPVNDQFSSDAAVRESTYAQGGYESGSGTHLAEGAGEIMIEKALELLNLIR